MNTFITFMFYAQIVDVIVTAVKLPGKYPRQKFISLGSDVLSLILSIAMLTWVSYLKFL